MSSELWRTISYSFALLVLMIGSIKDAASQDQPESKEMSHFVSQDINEDGQLSLEELLTGQPDEQHAKLRRDFQVVDWNHDDGLTQNEYLAIPGIAPANDRVGVPDPVFEIAFENISLIEKQWKGWDTNRNDSLDQEEFSNTSLLSEIPEMADLDFSFWDINDDETLDKDEAINVVYVAFGIRSQDGLELRKVAGVVFNASRFRHLDADNDGFLGSADLQLRKKLDEEKSAKFIAKHDQNQDLKLSPEEAWPINSSDILVKYLAADVDLNGLVSKEELLSATPKFQLGVAAFVFPVFDLDGDRQLNFREYRLSPLANYDEAWHEARHRQLDLNFDGMLSLSEFTFGRKLEAHALRSMVFEKLDHSNDQRLDLNEFEFGINVSRVPRQVVFTFRDKDLNHLLTLEELQANQPENLKPRLARDYQVVNWDGNEGLSIDEYGTIPVFSSRKQRTAVPDPVLDITQKYLGVTEENWEVWDENNDEKLDVNEFQKSKLQASIPGLTESEFPLWDLDEGGSLEKEEAYRVIEAAFGVRSLDGVLLRNPNGTVFNWKGFRFQDADNDGFIGSADIQLRRKLDAEQAADRISMNDLNRDGKLSAEEALPTMKVDVFSRFLNADKNLDGVLSSVELIDAAHSYQKTIATYVLLAFDSDGDNQLNLTEFRLSLLGNYHEAWQERLSDQDNDGKLSLEEFTWNREIESRGMVAFMFNKLDLTGDDFLDLDEFQYQTNHRDPKREFKSADRNADELLIFDEFVSVQRDVAQEKRDFGVFDLNADQSLSYAEYLSIPSRTSILQRVAAADPIISMAETLLQQLNQIFTAADKNRDEQLSVSEFRNGRVTRSVPGMQLSGFKDWDRNTDGAVTMAEVQIVIFAACGVNRLDGLPCRESSGVVYNVMRFKRVDLNKDDEISREEFLEHGSDGENAAEKFQKADSNEDAILSFTEWGTFRIVDPLTEFLKYDTDLSGRLSATEIVSGFPERQQLVAQYYISGFDDDDDGELSLTEYRRVPTANVLAPWHSKRSDRDGDGQLSFSEFYDDHPIELTVLAHEYFGRYDRNKDGKLSFQEFDFRINGEQAPVDISFFYHDENDDNSLSLDELFGDFKDRTDQRAQAVLGRMEEMFLAADADQNKELSLNEFRAGRKIMDSNGRSKSTNHLSANVARNKEAEEGSHRFWIIVTFNVLLVAGVGWYILLR